MKRGAPVVASIATLPATVPFVAPEAIERQTGRPLVLRLGANESAFGPSPRAVAAMQEAASWVNWYGDPESHELRAALAAHHGVPMECIVVGCGIDDLLGLIVRSFVDRGEVAVTSRGGYPTFDYHVAGYGGRVERVERVSHGDYRNDLEAMAAAAKRTGARVVFLANPDNPSGSWHHASDVEALVGTLPDGCLLLLDEAYSDFAPSEALPPMDVGDPRVIRVRTFSKAHGMAGARIGYAIAPAKIIRTFEKIRLHFGVNLVGQRGALVSLGDGDHLRSVISAVAAGREDYAALARELGFGPLPSATNFVAMDTGSAERANAIMAGLAERDVFIRKPGVPPLDRCIRVTVGTPAERAQFAEILREVVANT